MNIFLDASEPRYHGLTPLVQALNGAYGCGLWTWALRVFLAHSSPALRQWLPGVTG